MDNILSLVGDVIEKEGVHNLASYLENDPKTKFIVESIPDKNITGIDSTKFERYYEWQYPIFTSHVAGEQGEEYYVKIVAAVGFGKALGMAVNVEVIPGSSPQAESFQKQNPQAYQESSSVDTTRKHKISAGKRNNCSYI